MPFLWPSVLWLLLIVPALLAAYVLAQRRRQRYALRYASLSLVKEALARGPGIRRHIPPALYLLALTVMLVALARPFAEISVPSLEGTVILAIDVSGSMLADDLKPNRMEAAKDAARAFAQKQPQTMRVGVVAFSTDAQIVQSPTTDQQAVIEAINRLRPQRATAIGRAILTSLDAIFEPSEEVLPSSEYLPSSTRDPSASARPKTTPAPKGQFAPAAIVLLSDGENNQFPSPLTVVDQAANRGVRVYTVGVGSPEGTLLRIEGRATRTRLDEATLKQIAQATGAEYFRASTATDLRSIYENLATQLVFRTQRTEITVYATALAALMSVFAGALSLLWFNRLP